MTMEDPHSTVQSRRGSFFLLLSPARLVLSQKTAYPCRYFQTNSCRLTAEQCPYAHVYASAKHPTLSPLSPELKHSDPGMQYAYYPTSPLSREAAEGYGPYGEEGKQHSRRHSHPNIQASPSAASRHRLEPHASPRKPMKYRSSFPFHFISSVY